MANIWTDDQLAAITEKGRSIIVSAAAGSGKTAVLVERIIRKLQSGECDIDRLLVVTFTNAAASEMKAKISSAISEEISKDPQNAYMRRQLAILPAAHIETVHAFCLRLIRDNFNSLGISQNFRIADNAEANLMKKRAMDEALERLYSEFNDNPDFKAAFRLMTNGKNDDRLAETALEIYEKIQSCPFPFGWLDEKEKMLDVSNLTDAGQSSWGEYILSRVKALCQSARGFLERGIKQIESVMPALDAYLPAFYDDLAAVQAIENKCGESWDEVWRFLQQYKPARLAGVRKFEDKKFLEKIKSYREMWKKFLADINEKLITCSSDDAIKSIGDTSASARGLFAIVREFSKCYENIKNDENILDFSDLEHKALELLICRDGHTGELQKTPLAEEISQGFNEIMVDEYQDTNAAQDMIFKAVSRDEKNIFMVGDVKQSIYKFRLANPSIFLRKYISRRDVKDACKDEPCSISMSKNFRSRKNVLDAVNFIFAQTMSERLGDMDYTAREALYAGAAYENENSHDYDTELNIIDMDILPDDEEYPKEDKATLEARFTARRIKQLINSGFQITDSETKKLRPVRADDIAILLRSVGGKSGIYENALKAEGISCSTDVAGEFFRTTEIMTINSLLSVIDNMAKDIELVSLMRSPVYSISAAYLAEIRTSFPDCRFSRAAVCYAKENPESDCAKVINDIENLRGFLMDSTVSELIWHIYMSMDFFARFSAYENGEARTANLIAFYEFSRGFDSAACGGLTAFLRVIEEMSANDEAPPQAVQAMGAGVKIMSIHKSKGLEFPVAVVPDCAKLFNEEDTKKPMLFHESLGVGLKIRDEQRHIEYPSSARTAIADAIRNEAVSEELRVLYVAFTRAKEKLIINMSVPSFAACAEKWSICLNENGFDGEALAAQRSPAMWVAAPFMRHKCGAVFTENGFMQKPFSCNFVSCDFGMDINIISKDNEMVAFAPMKKKVLPTADKQITAGDEALVDECLKTLNFTYPYKASCEIPSKITPTSIKGRFIDNEAAENATQTDNISEKSSYTRLAKLQFGKDNPLSAAERGIAHHVAMQFINFENCRDLGGIKSEIARLRDKEIISSRQAEAVSAETLAGFFNSLLGKRALKSEWLRKEFKFSLLCPANLFFNNTRDDEILLQGVVDCMFEENGEIVIIDFKSDSIKRGDEWAAAEKYKTQLSAYSYAIGRITGKKVKSCELYFFATGQSVTI